MTTGESAGTHRGTLLGSLVVDLLYLSALPVLLPCVLGASRFFTRPKYRRGLARKLWRFPPRPDSKPELWLHAVSVGEARTALPLVEVLPSRFPDWGLSVSVSTYTGFEVAKTSFPDREVFYFPLDLSPIVRRAMEHRRPSAVLLMELELWPNFLLEARRRGVPVFVVNGRLSERSYRRYRKLGAAGRCLFRQVTAYGVQNEAYAERFLALGVEPSKVTILGNLKHDRRPSAVAGEGPTTRAQLGWGAERSHVVLVGGCTHPGEEAMLCSLWRELRDVEPGLRLVLAPRHIERLVAGEPEAWGCDRPIARWSAVKDRREDLGERVLLVDTVGELERFYAAADIAIVGGSFIAHGGHNLLEPARIGRACCFGPHHWNFQDEADLLLRENAALCAADVSELRREIEALLRNPTRRRDLGERAAAVAAGLEGAADRHADWLARHLGA